MIHTDRFDAFDISGCFQEEPSKADKDKCKHQCRDQEPVIDNCNNRYDSGEFQEKL